jgi:hypothetical protein
MKKLILYCSVFSALMGFISCQKEVSGDVPSTASSSGTLIGNWKFVNLSAATESLVEVRDGIDVAKTITYSNYTTINNTGTIRFDATTMYANNLGYAVDALAKSYSYFNGVLEDSIEAPFSGSIAPATTQSNYKRIGTDSLYFEGGSIFNTSLGTITTQPNGAKLKWEGNKLYMTVVGVLTKLEDLGGGIRQLQNSRVKSVTTLEKQ